MTTYEKMLDATKALYNEIYQHPFVQGIGNGSLPKDKFVFYMIQDYSYLIDYTRVFSIGAAKAVDCNDMNFFTQVTVNAINNEINMHWDYMHRLGIKDDEVLNTPQALTNISYTSFMQKTAYEGDEAAIIAAILPCESTYQMIGKRLAKDFPESLDHPFYGDWVKTYSSPEMEQTLGEITAILNRLTENLPEDHIQKLVKIFKTSTQFEKAFWDMSWNMSYSSST